MSWPSRLTNVFRSEEVDRELEDELEFHIAARTEEFIERGMAPEEANLQARRRFGNRLNVRESSRDTKLLAWLESVLHDVRFGCGFAEERGSYNRGDPVAVAHHRSLHRGFFADQRIVSAALACPQCR